MHNRFRILRASEPSTTDCPCCGAELKRDDRITVNLPTNSLIVDGRSITLPPMAAEIMAALLEYWPNAVTREQLLDRVYGIDSGARTDRAIDTHIKRLRWGLEGLRVQIGTIHGSGYQLVISAPGKLGPVCAGCASPIDLKHAATCWVGNRPYHGECYARIDTENTSA